MAEITQIIKKYYYNQKNNKIDAVISQIEHITTVTAKLLKSDFVAVYLKRDADSATIPIAYHNTTDNNIVQYELLEKIWKHKHIDINNNENLFLTFTPEEITNNKYLSFLKKYDFNHFGYLPFQHENNSRILVVAFWEKSPEIIIDKISGFLIDLYKMAFSLINDADILKQVSDYSLRLSELIALFELQVEDYSFKELLGKIIDKMVQIVSRVGFAVFICDEKSGYYKLSKYQGPQSQDNAFVDLLASHVRTVCENSNDNITIKHQWQDITLDDKARYEYTKAALLKLDDNTKLVIFAFTVDDSKFTNDDNEILSVFALFARMILNYSKMVANLRQANHTLEKSSARFANIETLAALSDMTSGIAHDFNNMIGGVVGRVQLMKLKTNDDILIGELNKIEAMVMEGAQTVKRIQEFSVGAKNKKLKHLNLCQLMHEYFTAYSDILNERGASRQVSVNFKSCVDDGVINGVEEDIITALNKLIENAIEYSSENQPVNVTLAEENNYLKISVADLGAVIDENIGKKIFYPFFSTKNRQGAGLGLAIVHGIVPRHSGKIEFSSNDVGGTVFNILIPKVDEISEISEITRKDRKLDNLSILVVDDDQQIREVLSDMLSIDGHKITACCDGFSALKEFEKGEFDLMITDLGMPGMSGLELAGKVHDSKPEMPIAMITGWGTQLNEDEIALKGIKSVLPKPFHLKDIKTLVNELVVNT